MTFEKHCNTYKDRLKCCERRSTKDGGIRRGNFCTDTFTVHKHVKRLIKHTGHTVGCRWHSDVSALQFLSTSVLRCSSCVNVNTTQFRNYSSREIVNTYSYNLHTFIVGVHIYVHDLII